MLSVAHHRAHAQAGFTLVELALVVTIIGLLAGGALKAQEMIANSRMATTIKQVQAFQQAIRIFSETYYATPGDFNAAQVVLPNCINTTQCYNGNGDGLIAAEEAAWQSVAVAINSENTQVWRHLAQADLLGGVQATGAQTGFGISHPAASIYGGFHARQGQASSGLPDGMVAVLRADPQGTWQGGLAISPRDAAHIDRKMDDGQAFSGQVYAISTGHSGGCGDANVGAQNATGYEEVSTRRTCDMLFKIWPVPPP